MHLDDIKEQNNREKAERLLRTVYELEERGVCGASEILDFYKTHRIDPQGDTNFLAVVNQFIWDKRRTLLDESGVIHGVEFGNVRVLFPSHNVVTFKYGVGEDNYAAVGLSFVLVANRLHPYYIQVNDRTSFATSPEMYLNGSVEAFMEWAFSFMSDDDEGPELELGVNSKGIITYPLTDPRIGLDRHNRDTPEQEAVWQAFVEIENMVAAHSPTVASYIFGSWNPCYNIDTPAFRIRTYDYHEYDELLTWNFVWRDFAIQWYKHSHRSTCVNRLLSEAEIAEMLKEVKAGLDNYVWPPEERKSELTPEQAERIAGKLLRNGKSGAFTGVGYLLLTDEAGNLIKPESDDDKA